MQRTKKTPKTKKKRKKQKKNANNTKKKTQVFFTKKKDKKKKQKKKTMQRTKKNAKNQKKRKTINELGGLNGGCSYGVPPTRARLRRRELLGSELRALGFQSHDTTGEPQRESDAK